MPVFLGIIRFVDLILTIYMWIVIASAVITWVNPDPYNPIVRFLYGVTEPVLARIRRFVPTSFGGLDIAPMLLIFVIIGIKMIVLDALVQMVVGAAVGVS